MRRKEGTPRELPGAVGQPGDPERGLERRGVKQREGRVTLHGALWGKGAERPSTGHQLRDGAGDGAMNDLGKRGARKGLVWLLRASAAPAGLARARHHASQGTPRRTCLWLHTPGRHGGGRHKFTAKKRRGPKTQSENAGVTLPAERKKPGSGIPTVIHSLCQQGKSLQSFTVNLYTLLWMPRKV